MLPIDVTFDTGEKQKEGGNIEHSFKNNNCSKVKSLDKWNERLDQCLGVVIW